jgi:hypothetical protein
VEVTPADHGNSLTVPARSFIWVSAHFLNEPYAEALLRQEDIALGLVLRTRDQRMLQTEGIPFRKKLITAKHIEKTRRIEFGRFAEQNRERRGEGKPETFDFLGFTHISGKDRNGSFSVRRKTIGKRMRAKLLEVKGQLRARMHEPVAQTGKWLRSVVQGYFNYHAVPENSDTLWTFWVRLARLWRTSLVRRGQRNRYTWARVDRLVTRWFPTPRILHPWPEQRFVASHPR